MSPWIGNIIFIICIVSSILIRIPHDKVSQETAILESRKGLLEKILLGLVLLGMVVVPLLSFTSPLAFADYSPHLAIVGLGALVMGLSLWLFHRTHKDLGKNWSASLELRQGHVLVTEGIYKSVRHPMYTSIFLLGIGQVCLLSNWIAGPALLIAFSVMFFCRLASEEKMMLDQFGERYHAYRLRTKRIIPGVW